MSKIKQFCDKNVLRRAILGITLETLKKKTKPWGLINSTEVGRLLCIEQTPIFDPWKSMLPSESCQE